MSKVKRLADALGIKGRLPYGDHGYEGEVYDAYVSVVDRMKTGVISLELVTEDEAMLLAVCRLIRQKQAVRVANMEGMTEEQKVSILEATK